MREEFQRQLFRSDVGRNSFLGWLKIYGQKIGCEVFILTQERIDHDTDLPTNPEGEVAQNDTVNHAERVVSHEHKRSGLGNGFKFSSIELDVDLCFFKRSGKERLHRQTPVL